MFRRSTNKLLSLEVRKMNRNNKPEVERLAAENAGAGLTLVEETLTSILGPRPIFDPGRDPRDRDAVQSVNNPRIEEIQDDLARLRAELTRHVSRTTLLVGLGAAFAFEVLGAVMVLRTLGFENPERLVLGAGLAFLVFFLTYECVHLGRVTSSVPGEKPKRSPGFLPLVTIYATLVIAIAIVRSGDAQLGEGASISFAWANAFIMVACSVGPAWLGENLLRRLAPVSPLAKEVQRLRKEQRRHERNRERGTAHIEARMRASEDWDRKMVQTRALYHRVHELRRAEEERTATHADFPDTHSAARLKLVEGKSHKEK